MPDCQPGASPMPLWQRTIRPPASRDPRRASRKGGRDDPQGASPPRGRAEAVSREARPSCERRGGRLEARAEGGPESGPGARRESPARGTRRVAGDLASDLGPKVASNHRPGGRCTSPRRHSRERRATGRATWSGGARAPPGIEAVATPIRPRPGWTMAPGDASKVGPAVPRTARPKVARNQRRGRDLRSIITAHWHWHRLQARDDQSPSGGSVSRRGESLPPTPPAGRRDSRRDRRPGSTASVTGGASLRIVRRPMPRTSSEGRPKP